MERSHIRIGCGAPDAGYGIWLLGPRDIDPPEETDRVMSAKFTDRRSLLVKHLYVARQNGTITVRLNRDDT